MINGKINEIYQLLREYIVKKSKYSPSVLKNVIDNKYPLVVFENNINTLDYRTQDRYRIDQVRSLSFEINIFAITQNNIDSSIICDELANLVCDVMQEYYGMQGGLDAKLKNINSSKATKYVLHFTCKVDVRRNKIY